MDGEELCRLSKCHGTRSLQSAAETFVPDVAVHIQTGNKQVGNKGLVKEQFSQYHLEIGGTLKVKLALSPLISLWEM